MGGGELRLNPDVPMTMGPLDLQDFYFEHKLHQVEAHEQALKYIPEVDKAWADLTGRKYEYLHPYLMEDAEVAVIGLGSAMGTVRHVVNELRAEGVKAGMIKMRVFRPFPVEALKKAVGDVPVLGVMEKCISFGAPGGPLFEEIKTAYYDDTQKPLIADYIHGLGGRDTSKEMVRKVYESLQKIHEKGAVEKQMHYIGVRGE
jgi:pyruvate ferredoxin oxidoreductase alpha subunit